MSKCSLRLGWPDRWSLELSQCGREGWARGDGQVAMGEGRGAKERKMEKKNKRGEGRGARGEGRMRHFRRHFHKKKF